MNGLFDIILFLRVFGFFMIPFTLLAIIAALGGNMKTRYAQIFTSVNFGFVVISVLV